MTSHDTQIANALLLGLTILSGAMAALFALTGCPVFGVICAINATMFASQIG